MANKKGGPKARTNKVSLMALRRRQFVVEMRTTGAKYREIARAAVLRFGKSKLPRGWDERYAYKDLMRLLESTDAQLVEGREHIRQIELDRLDTMTMATWERAATGEREAIQTVLSLMQRRAKITGIDAPIEYTIDDIRSIAARVEEVIDQEIKDPIAKQKVYAALGFIDVQ